MITVASLELRRIFRRRLSVLLLMVPAALVLFGLVLGLFGKTLSPSWFWLLIPASSLVVFGQAVLSDREGHLDLALATSRTPRRFPLCRHILLFLVPFAFQFGLFRVLGKLVGIV